MIQKMFMFKEELEEYEKLKTKYRDLFIEELGQELKDKECGNKDPRCMVCHRRTRTTTTLNKTHIYALQIFIEYSRKNKTRLIPTTEIINNLDRSKRRNSLYTSYTGLKYFGFLQTVCRERDDGNPNSGLYVLTDKAFEFMEGKLEVPIKVKSTRGMKVAESRETKDYYYYFNKYFNYSEDTEDIAPEEIIIH